MAEPVKFIEPPWDWLTDVHEERMGWSWRPDPHGRHDQLTRHPYTNRPGRVIRWGNGAYWKEEPDGVRASHHRTSERHAARSLQQDAAGRANTRSGSPLPLRRSEDRDSA